MKYTKPALDLPAQLQKLKDRGLLVTDDAVAMQRLENIGYYRFSGYTYPFLVPPDRLAFKPGTRLEQIERLYEFDRELRILVSDAIERIEVSLRSRIVRHTSLQWGAHWFLDAQHFHPRFNHGRFIEQVEREVGVRYDPRTSQRVLPTSHPETFLEHYYKKYGDPYLPPFWMTTQVLTMGALSRLFEGIGDVPLKLAIARPFNVPTKVLVSWLHSLAHLRNICAHHGRLWNRVFSISPLVTDRHVGVIRTANRFEGHAVVLIDVLDVANPGHSWRQDFKTLLAQFPEIDPAAMGFGAQWESSAFWRT